MIATLRSHRLVPPTLFAVAAFALLVGLGVWQLERKEWKDALVAGITARVAAPSAGLPPADAWPKLDPEHMEFRRVAFSAELLNDREALVYTAGSPLRPDVTGPGYWVMTPARVPGGGVVIVNRGFAPEGMRSPATRAQAQVKTANIVGALRWPEPRGVFTPEDDPGRNLFFTRDPTRIAAAKGLGLAAPFYVEQEAPPAPGGFPQVGRIEPRLPNTHLQYAVTWFGLAGTLLLVFAFWVRARLREER